MCETVAIVMHEYYAREVILLLLSLLFARK